MPQTCADTISENLRWSILNTMQSSFSTAMTATTFKRGETGSGTAIGLEYWAAARTNSSNGQMRIQKHAAAQKNRANRNADVSAIRPPIRWGINE
jgi:hypothetical protein